MRFTLMAINFVQDFRGNKDQNTIVFHKLRTARFIRILPQSWYGHVSMQMEFYGCPGRRIILNLKQSPLPQGTVIIYRQGGGGQWFLERSHSFQGERRRKVGRRLQSVERVPRKLLPMWEIIGILQSFMGGSGEHNQSLPTTPPPPPPFSPHQNPGPLHTQKKIIMIIKKIEMHENNYNTPQNIQPIRIQGRRYIRRYYTQPFHCAPQSTCRNVNVENLILYFLLLHFCNASDTSCM